MADILLHEWESYAVSTYDAAYVATRPLAVATLAALLSTRIFRQPDALAID